MLQFGREIAPSVSWEILAHVKRTGGISVNELAALLKMSYMGVKQHCDALKRRGYLDTWRRPKATGRPEKIFRPTGKLDLILPNWGNELCFNILAYSAEVMGETTPERLLHSFLQQKAEYWAAKMKGKTLPERTRQFVKIRNAEGWICELVEEADHLLIIEHHSPLKELAKAYPAIWTIEARALEHCFKVEGGLVRTEENGRWQLILPLPVSETKVATQAPTKQKIKEEEPAPPPAQPLVESAPAESMEAVEFAAKESESPEAEIIEEFVAAAPAEIEVAQPEVAEKVAQDDAFSLEVETEIIVAPEPDPEPAPEIPLVATKTTAVPEDDGAPCLFPELEEATQVPGQTSASEPDLLANLADPSPATTTDAVESPEEEHSLPFEGDQGLDPVEPTPGSVDSVEAETSKATTSENVEKPGRKQKKSSTAASTSTSTSEATPGTKKRGKSQSKTQEFLFDFD